MDKMPLLYEEIDDVSTNNIQLLDDELQYIVKEIRKR